MLTFKKLRNANVNRCEYVFHPLDSWSPTDWATAMGGECGEALNLIKKLRRGEDIDPAEIGKELADIVIYADLLAARLRIDLGEAVSSKFNEVSDRHNSDIKLCRTAVEKSLAEIEDAAQDRLDAINDESLVGLQCALYNIRAAVGDAEGRLMFSELVDRVREVVADRDGLREARQATSSEIIRQIACAIAAYAADAPHSEGEPDPDYPDFEWDTIAGYLSEDHCGDCTNVASACRRCAAEEWLWQAKFVVAKCPAIGDIAASSTVTVPAYLVEGLRKSIHNTRPGDADDTWYAAHFLISIIDEKGGA